MQFKIKSLKFDENKNKCMSIILDDKKMTIKIPVGCTDLLGMKTKDLPKLDDQQLMFFESKVREAVNIPYPSRYVTLHIPAKETETENTKEILRIFKKPYHSIKYPDGSIFMWYRFKTQREAKIFLSNKGCECFFMQCGAYYEYDGDQEFRGWDKGINDIKGLLKNEEEINQILKEIMDAKIKAKYFNKIKASE